MISSPRIRMHVCFHEVCNGYPGWAALEGVVRDRLVRHMERGCFAITIDECTKQGIDRTFTDARFVNRYSMICHKLLANLDVKGSVGSSYLIDKIISGEFKAIDAGLCTSFELCPEASTSEREMIRLRQNQKVALKVSRAHVCPKCKGNETIPIKYQSRAGDEDSSLAIKCVLCSHKWKKR